MSRGLKNCNPGNIRQSKSRYKGEVRPSRDPAFKQFESLAWGYRAIFMLLPGEYQGFLLYVYQNGKAVKIPVKSFDTKSNRRRLTGAYSDKAPLAAILHLPEDGEAAVYSSDGRMLLVNTADIAPKAVRSSQGSVVMALKKNKTVTKALLAEEARVTNPARYRAKSLPAPGAILKDEDAPEPQLKLE